MHQKDSELLSEFQPYLGRAVGAYVLESIVGVGGMGAVFVATHTRLDKKVAVKLIRTSFRNQKEAANRFFSEAKAAAAIGHENIIDVFDVGEDIAAGPFLAMELLEHSESLGALLIREGPLPLARMAKITLQIANALYATHASGLVHCDLKPSNILLIKALGQSDVVKIIDFGIARETPSQHQDPLISSRLVLGTPKYMSPEQAIGRRPDGRSDQYALGLLVYTMLTGRPPFDGTPSEVMKRQYHDPPAPLRAARQDVTPALEAVVFRALAKKPEERFPSIKQFGEILHETIEQSLRARTVPRLPVAVPAKPAPDLSHYKAMFEAEGGLTGAALPAPSATPPPRPDLAKYKELFEHEGGLTGGHATVTPAKPTPDLSQYKAMLADDSGLTGAAPPVLAAPPGPGPDLAKYKALFEKEGGATGAAEPHSPQTPPGKAPALELPHHKAMFEGGLTGPQPPLNPAPAEPPNKSAAGDIFSLLGRSPTPSPPPAPPLPALIAPPVEAQRLAPPRPEPTPPAPREPRSRASYVASGAGVLVLSVGLYWGYLSGYIAPLALPPLPRQATSKKVIPSFTPQTSSVLLEEKKDPRLPLKNPRPNPDGTVTPELVPPPVDPASPEPPKTPDVIEVPSFDTPDVKSLPPTSQRNK